MLSWTVLTVVFIATACGTSSTIDNKQLPYIDGELPSMQPSHPRSANTKCPDHFPVKSSCHILKIPIPNTDKLHTPYIEVSYAVMPGTNPALKGTALMFMQGGPGAASTDLLGLVGEKPYDVVYIDQRGTGFGSTNWSCPAVQLKLPELLESSSTEAQQIRFDIYADCAIRLNLDLGGIHTSTEFVALDVITIMKHLGYTHWVAYGTSYGTSVVSTLLHYDPMGLKGAVLDGYMTPSTDLTNVVAEGLIQSIRRTDRHCSSNMKCTSLLKSMPSRYGSTIEDALIVLMGEYNKEPLIVELSHTDGNSGRTLTVFIDGDTAAFVFLHMLSLRATVAMVPSIMYGLAYRDATTERFLALLAATYAQTSAATIAEGTYFSVICAEWSPHSVGKPIPTHPVSDAILRHGPLEACPHWQSSIPLYTTTNTYPLTTISKPTIIFSGEYDPLTPPFETTHTTLFDNAISLTFKGYSHNVWLESQCADQIILDFITDTNLDVDTSCADTPNHIAWTGPSTFK